MNLKWPDFTFDDQSGFSVCRLCLRKMRTTDLYYHFCDWGRNEHIHHLRVTMFVTQIMNRTRKVTLLSIWFLRSILGKDVSCNIGRMLHDSRKDLCLWYPVPRSVRMKKWKRKSKALNKFISECMELDYE